MFDRGDDSFATILYFDSVFNNRVYKTAFLLGFDFISDIVITKTNRLMLFREIIIFYCGIV